MSEPKLVPMDSGLSTGRDPLPHISIFQSGTLESLPPSPSGDGVFVNIRDSVELPRMELSPEDEAPIDIVDCAQQTIETTRGAIWIQGNSILCSCPDCQAPMTIRLWLMVADCWQCETSIELSPEQQEAVRQLAFAEHPSTRAVRSENRTIPTVAPSAVPAAQDSSLFPQIATDRETVLADAMPTGESRVSAAMIRRLFQMTPAWLVSFIVHLVLLMILAMILLPQLTDNQAITISTFVSDDDSEGGEILIDDPEREIEDDLPLAQQLAEADEEARMVMERARQDAAELVNDPQPETTLPDLDQVKENITQRTGPLDSFAARDPRVRREIVKREGGTTLTEAAVSRGLRWLASVQNEDGSWSLRYYNSSKRQRYGDMAGTSLALLPFLGAGQTHEYGVYKENVAKGLKWILEHQQEDGDLRGTNSIRRSDLSFNYEMYAHGQASIVLVEAFAMTGDERFREPAQRAIRFIEKAQHRQGGWRYRPGQSGDTSVFGWQLMALQSARSSQLGLKTDKDTFELASQYLDLAGRRYRGKYRKYPSGSLYRYQPSNDDPKHALTAEAMLCRFYLGWSRDRPAVRSAVEFLTEEHPPRRDEANIYYWYYATQALHHYGGSEWKTWNAKMRDLLVLMQVRSGRNAGSWSPSDFEWGPQGGRIFVTALAICTLEVYYRHLPLFDQLKIEK